MSPPARSPRLTWAAILAMLFLGCSVPEGVTVEYRDGRISTHKSFLVRDSTIILPEGVVEVKDLYGSYEMPVKASVVPCSQVKDLTYITVEVNSFYRSAAGIAGGLAGAVIGAWAGNHIIGRSRQGLEDLGPGVLRVTIGAVVGATVGYSSSRYLVDRLSTKTIHLDFAIPSQRDSLGIDAEHPE